MMMQAASTEHETRLSTLLPVLAVLALAADALARLGDLLEQRVLVGRAADFHEGADRDREFQQVQLLELRNARITCDLPVNCAVQCYLDLGTLHRIPVLIRLVFKRDL